MKTKINKQRGNMAASVVFAMTVIAFSALVLTYSAAYSALPCGEIFALYDLSSVADLCATDAASSIIYTEVAFPIRSPGEPSEELYNAMLEQFPTGKHSLSADDIKFIISGMLTDKQVTDRCISFINSENLTAELSIEKLSYSGVSISNGIYALNDLTIAVTMPNIYKEYTLSNISAEFYETSDGKIKMTINGGNFKCTKSNFR